MTLTALVQKITHAFQTRHQRDSRWIVAAPGRVNLIGEHTDSNDGFVFPMAIDRFISVMGRKDHSLRLDFFEP